MDDKEAEKARRKYLRDRKRDQEVADREARGRVAASRSSDGIRRQHKKQKRRSVRAPLGGSFESNRRKF